MPATDQPTTAPRSIKAITIATALLAITQGLILIFAVIYTVTAASAEAFFTEPYLLAYGLPFIVGLLTIGTFIYFMVGIRHPHKAFYTIFTSLMTGFFIIGGIRLVVTGPSVGIGLMMVLSAVALVFLIQKETDTWFKQLYAAKQAAPRS